MKKTIKWKIFDNKFENLDETNKFLENLSYQNWLKNKEKTWIVPQMIIKLNE